MDTNMGRSNNPRLGTAADRVVNNAREYKKYNPELPDAIIVDIDGTVALITNRSPFDESKWEQDVPHQPIIDLLNHLLLGLSDEVTVIFMTGRRGGDDREERTRAWLNLNTNFGAVNDILIMREEFDNRGDADVKRDLYNKYVNDKYNVLWVFEDRNRMVNFWREEMKLCTLQVNDGDF